MKPVILFSALPTVFLAAGFGAGMSFDGAPAPGDAKSPAAEHAEPAQDSHDVFEAASVAAPGHAAPAQHGAIEVAQSGEATMLPSAEQDTHEASAAHHGAGEHATAPASTTAAGHGDTPVAASDEVATAPVVRLGRMTVPVYKPKSVTYVVADFGVAVPDDSHAERYKEAEQATRLRDAILYSMTRAAERPVLRGASIDSDKLAQAIHKDIAPEFRDIEEILFLSLYKQDVPRS